MGREVVRGILDGRMEVVGEDVEVLGHQGGAVCGDDQLYTHRSAARIIQCVPDDWEPSPSTPTTPLSRRLIGGSSHHPPSAEIHSPCFQTIQPREDPSP